MALHARTHSVSITFQREFGVRVRSSVEGALERPASRGQHYPVLISSVLRIIAHEETAACQRFSPN